MEIKREKIDFDVLFVGGGPASLAGAISLKQMAKKKELELEVALIEKGADIGSHAISGAVLNPVALEELIPDFLDKGFPLERIVKEDAFYFLTESRAFPLFMTPKYMRNEGFCIISLSKFTRWLAIIAEDLGVNIFPGFAGQSLLYGPDDKTVIGVRTGDKGLGKDSKAKGNFEAGIDLMAKITVLGEGARGSLMKDIAQKLDLYAGKMPPVYETGIKEVIELPEKNYFSTSQANDIHLMGYPLGMNMSGGGFIYQMKENRIALGFLAGLSYSDHLFDLYEEFLKFKYHPFIADIISKGKVIEQGARTVSSGGYYTIPKSAVDGAIFIGGCASIQNMPALKGIHLSMKSGMLAADAIIEALEKKDFTAHTLNKYEELFEKSWLKEEMFEGRNFYQTLSKKGLLKFIHLGSQYISNGRGIMDNLPIEEDCKTLKPLTSCQKNGKKESLSQEADGVLYVDKLTGVYLSKTMHREDQPCHLIIDNPDLCINECYNLYDSPCTRFCPGNVYEIHTDENTGQRELKLNPSNCLHCKTCDIKDPYQNIRWTCPEGGEGPGYKLL